MNQLWIPSFPLPLPTSAHPQWKGLWLLAPAYFPGKTCPLLKELKYSCSILFEFCNSDTKSCSLCPTILFCFNLSLSCSVISDTEILRLDGGLETQVKPLLSLLSSLLSHLEGQAQGEDSISHHLIMWAAPTLKVKPNAMLSSTLTPLKWGHLRPHINLSHNSS